MIATNPMLDAAALVICIALAVSMVALAVGVSIRLMRCR